MAGYTRQSVADIINGAEITAPPLNAEFNQLVAAFNGTTGHTHTGATGDAPKINLATSVSGILSAANGGTGGANKMDATTAPVAANDNTQGYAPGSLWENVSNGRVYICVGNATGAAVWRELVTIFTNNKIEPAGHNTIDLGTNLIRFKDLFLQGGLVSAGNSSLGGTLSVTGASNLSSATLSSSLGVTGTATLATVDINGGNIDGTIIGNSTAAAGTFTTITTTGLATLPTVDINAGAIDGTVIGGSTAAAITGTTITASTGFTGTLTGNVTGNLTGNVTGNVSGDVTGDLTGNVSASSGSSTFNNVTVNGTLDVTGTTIANVTDPVNAQDAATKNYVDTADALKLNLSGGTMSGDITMGGNTVTGLGTPSATSDAATKGYVDTSVANVIDSAPGTLDTLNELAAALGDDANFSTTITNSIATKLPLAGGTMTGDIALGANKVTSTATPATNDTLTRKGYVDTQDATKLNLSGGTMSGAIAMGTSKITGLGDPTAAQDAATKTYVDTADATKLNLTGGTLSGNLAMGSNNITGLATPTANDHATNKSYVDGILGSATSAATSATNAANSATAAASSATSAATSATNAAASYDSFDDRYLGAKSSAPSTDNDGDALVTGALYWNSTNNNLNIWDGSAWADASFADANLAAFATAFTLPTSDGSANQVLQTNGSGTISFGTVSSDLVNDGSPQLGANLDLNGSNITGTGSINITGSVTTSADSSLNGVTVGNQSIYRGNGNLSLIAGGPQTSRALLYLNNNGGGTTLYGGSASTNVSAQTSYGIKLDGGDGDVTFTGASYDAYWDKSESAFRFNDNAKAMFGDGQDFQIYYDGSGAYLVDAGVGGITVKASGFDIKNPQGSETMATFAQNGAATLYYDNSAKLATTSTGVSVTGNIAVTGTVDGVDLATNIPASLGTAGQVLTVNAGGTAGEWADAAGGADLYAANPVSATNPTAGGNNAVAVGSGATTNATNAIGIGNSANAAGNQSVAIGTSANSGQQGGTAVGWNANANTNDGTALGRDSVAFAASSTAFHNSRAAGTDALAACIDANGSSYGVTQNSTNAIAMGYQAVAGRQHSVALGYKANTSGNGSRSFGGFGLGVGTTASGEGSTAFGDGAISNVSYKTAFTTRPFAAQGDAQTGIFVLKTATTDATPKALSSDTNSAGQGNQVNVPDNGAFTFHGTIIAKQSASANAAAWKVEGLVVNNGGTITLTNSAITTISNTPAWGLALSADNTGSNKAMAITVTGAASTNIRWVSTIHTSEVIYA